MRVTKPKKRKLTKLSTLTKKADAVFSKFIRNRDAVELKGRCCTCGGIGTQCGHYVSRRYKRLRWNPQNAALQCSACNHWGHGRSDDFAIFLVNKYGIDILNELHHQKEMPFKLTREHLEQVIKAYS